MKHILWSDKYLDPGTDQEVEAQYSDKGAEREKRALWETTVYPLGNGRLGCTVFGSPKKERIQFNEDSLWVGNEECTGAYQPFGDVFISMDHDGAEDYRRELDLERAVQTVTYASNGVSYKREYFSSYPARVMVFRLSADKPGSLSGEIEMKTIHPVPVSAGDELITMTGDTGEFWYWKLMKEEPERLLTGREYASDVNIDLDMEAQLRVLHEGGRVQTSDGRVRFDGCDTVTMLLAAGTNYINDRDKGWRGDHPHERLTSRIEAAEAREYCELLEEHVADYQSLYNRMSLDLGRTPAGTADLSTSERVQKYIKDREDSGFSEDRGLEELLYQYARYLMISCSRPGHGALPANLQGLWLMNRQPSWRCDYHTDINVQMNYWFTDAANIGECYIPLAEWVDSIREVRKEETRKVLGVKRGWLMRSENGIFGGSTYFFQKGDSAWVCQNLWDHYAFTRDKEYLARYAYPVMKEICEFWLDHLKELPDGTLIAPDGRSPEHGPAKADGVTYDQALCWDLFNSTIEASGDLGVDAGFRAELTEKRDRLLGPQIGKWGQLQEWMEDIDDPEDDHRHINHLIGVYPGRQVHPAVNSEIAEAARVSVTARRDHGEGHPGWSRVWKSCIFGRLMDGEAAYNELATMMTRKLYDNMWTTHPPFQIDCNFGYAAGVHEMIMQSHLGCIELLPALPAAWAKGRVKGLRARGGYEIDITWEDGQLAEAVIRGVCNDAVEVEVRYKDNSRIVSVEKGNSQRLDPESFDLSGNT